jgi:hypothetical protein
MQMVAKGQGISLDKAKAEKAMAAMKTLPAHPDVPIGLKKMKEAGCYLEPGTIRRAKNQEFPRRFPAFREIRGDDPCFDSVHRNLPI